MMLFPLLAASAASLLLFPPTASAQFVKPPTDLTILRTPGNPNVTVSYKEPPYDICRTKNRNQKQYAGHVNLPPSTLASVSQDYPINSFFWFIEAQENPESAPLTIWLNGGPGSSSLLGMMTEVGPCEVKPFNDESLGTVPREYSWDAASNMLFLDQPNQVGFSYDVPGDGALSLLDPNGYFEVGKIAPPWADQPPASDIIVDDDSVEAFLRGVRSTLQVNGTFASGNPQSTANTTQIAAMAAWHFLQTWLLNFPQYNPQSKGINLFAESYGGIYGPTFSKYFEDQNQRREQGEISKDKTVEIHLESLGIVNGCIDGEIQFPYYQTFATSNPYGIKAVNQSQANQMLDKFYEKGGCKDQIQKCRQLKQQLDPKDFGDNNEVNKACSNANEFCNANCRNPFVWSERSYYDIVAPANDPFPPYYYDGYLNNATVQNAVGAFTNFTDTSGAIFGIFNYTGDFVRGGEMQALSSLLESGVRVALIYGDRDYICNWNGGEAVSLAINYTESAEFRKAGYQDIQVTDSLVGGQVRQHGNLSFARVYNAGHLIPAYQPQVSLAIFERIIFGKSIATGEEIDLSTYSTTGPSNSTKTFKAPPPPEPTCFVRSVRSCNVEEWTTIGNKQGTIINGVWHMSNETFFWGNDVPEPKDDTKTTPKKQQGGGEFEGDQRAGAGMRTPSVSALVLAFVFLVFLA